MVNHMSNPTSELAFHLFSIMTLFNSVFGIMGCLGGFKYKYIVGNVFCIGTVILHFFHQKKDEDAKRGDIHTYFNVLSVMVAGMIAIVNILRILGSEFRFVLTLIFVSLEGMIPFTCILLSFVFLFGLAETTCL